MFFKYAFHSAFFLLYLISSTFISHAQSYQPLVTYAAATVSIEGQGMYILGGIVTATVTTTVTPFVEQSFMIDLSQSWNTTNPVYKKLPNGPTTSSYSSSISPNGQDLITFANGTAYTYDLTSSVWTPIITNVNISRTNGLFAVTDQKAGVVYIPYGYNVLSGNWYTSSMLALNVNTKAISAIPMDPAINSTYYYATAWSAQYSSLYILSSGGTTSNFYTYTSALGWKDMTSIQNGYVPSPRTSTCLVSAFGGSKLILFGGVDPSRTTSLNDIYTLDISTMTWARGPDVDQVNGRAFASCAFSKGSFIVWGGTSAVNGNAVVPQNDVLVFDTTTGNWTSVYSPSPSSSSSSSSSSSTPSNSPSSENNSSSSSGSSGSHTIVIVCVVVVILVVLLAIAAVLFYRRRSRNAKASGDYNNNNNSNSYNGGEKSMAFPDEESYCSSYTGSNPQQITSPKPASNPKQIPSPKPASNPQQISSRPRQALNPQQTTNSQEMSSPRQASNPQHVPASPAPAYCQTDNSNFRVYQQPVMVRREKTRTDPSNPQDLSRTPTYQ
ncbi:hypothetical protein BGZ46_007688 [Entomortierella lignicola]|nr:hypothetical protein BGZ46_007688 [Entomortierella lignicola]